MKKLKYLRLFEAIESIILSKTLKYLSKDSRVKFLDNLKVVASKIDLPLSKYSDEFFEYLPFDEALDKNLALIDDPCSAKSENEFPQFAVEGETCKSGYLKRKWGTSVRSVVCPKCSGTGIEPKKNYELKWIKWWFDVDGNLVNVTGTDGKTRTQVGSSNTSLPDVSIHNLNKETSQNLDDYQVTDINIHSIRELEKFENGTYVHIRIDSRKVIGRLWVESRSRTCIIQNYADGGAPSGNDWRVYGKYSWVVSGGDYTGTPQILIPKELLKKPESVDEVDPYTWNAKLNFRDLSLSNDVNMRKQLSAANFAIVLDFLDLKASGFTKKYDIVSKREEEKTGAVALQNPEEVKKQNLNRYFNKISSQIKVDDSFQNIQNIIFRFFGFGKFGYYVLSRRNFHDFNHFITNLYRFMSGLDVEENYKRMTDHLKTKINTNMDYNQNVDSNLKLFNTDDKKLILKELQDINTLLYNKFKSYKVECIEDLEAFFSKMKQVREIFKSDRFQDFEYIYDIVDNMDDSYRVDRYLNRIFVYNDVKIVISDLQRLKRIFEKI